MVMSYVDQVGEYMVVTDDLQDTARRLVEVISYEIRRGSGEFDTSVSQLKTASASMKLYLLDDAIADNEVAQDIMYGLGASGLKDVIQAASRAVQEAVQESGEEVKENVVPLARLIADVVTELVAIEVA